MSDEKNVTIQTGGDWGGALLIVLIILCVGEPDLIDALVQRLMQCGP